MAKKKTTKQANKIDNLFDRLTSLLGEQPDCAVVAAFLADAGIDLGHKENIDMFMDIYDLPELGVVLKTWKGVFASLSIRMFRWARESKSFQMYSGDFTGGVTTDDDRNSVNKKLKIKPKQTRETPKTEEWPGTITDVYHLPEFKISFVFNGETKAIRLVTVSSYQFGSLTDEDIEAYNKENPT